MQIYNIYFICKNIIPKSCAFRFLFVLLQTEMLDIRKPSSTKTQTKERSDCLWIGKEELRGQ